MIIILRLYPQRLYANTRHKINRHYGKKTARKIPVSFNHIKSIIKYVECRGKIILRELLPPFASFMMTLKFIPEAENEIKIG